MEGWAIYRRLVLTRFGKRGWLPVGGGFPQ
jgi:hypothetical protein